MNTRSGESVSAQIGKMGTIADLANADFQLADGQPFNIKNDGVQPVKLAVQLAGMDDGDFIETTFVSTHAPAWGATVAFNISNF